MWLENKVFEQDMKNICSAEFIKWEKLRETNVFITGATGFIGFTIVSALLYANRMKGLNMTVTALVRDEQRAIKRFKEQLKGAEDLKFVVGDVENLPEIDAEIDYVIHGASQTASKAFVKQPVETIKTALHGTENMLELARQKNLKGMVYLSTMEVYGHPKRGHRVTENEIGMLSPLNIRNSYPIGKLQCECLCAAYANEYEVPVMLVRLTQIYGPGADGDDERVLAYFERCVKEKQDIILKTKGETERSYIYTADAATAILTILLKGQPGAAYNAADEETYCSIAKLAESMAESGGVQVHFQIEDAAEHGYLSTLYMDLNTEKLKALGWRAVSGETWLMKKTLSFCPSLLYDKRKERR